jgi:hypothetical protein
VRKTEASLLIETSRVFFAVSLKTSKGRYFLPAKLSNLSRKAAKDVPRQFKEIKKI